MSLVELVVLAAVQGAAEVLPISATGHEVVTRLWFDADRSAAWLTGPLELATAAALAFAIRQRIWDAVGEGVRAIARPTLFSTSPPARDAALVVVGTAVSLLVEAALRPYVEMWSQAPLAVGLGLLATGAALASTALAPRDAGRRAPRDADRKRSGAGAAGPSLVGMLAAGVAHGLATAPGASPVGAALVLLLWLGVRPARAVELSLALSIPTLVASGLAAVRASGQGAAPEMGLVAAGLIITFLSAALAVEALLLLSERRRTGALALWVIPLGLATVAYAHALPGLS